MMLPELEIVRYGNFHGSELESDSKWDGNENDREWKWDRLLYMEAGPNGNQ